MSERSFRWNENRRPTTHKSYSTCFTCTCTAITGNWPAFETALKANGKTYTGYVYEGTQHGFHNDTRPRYHEAAAKLAWQRTLDFFNKNLRS